MKRQDLKDLRDALCSAFPERSKLAQLVMFAFGENLAAISDGKDLNATVFELMSWAEAGGKLGELIAAAKKEQPENEALAAIASPAGDGAAGKGTAPKAPPRAPVSLATGPGLVALADVFARLYPSREGSYRVVDGAGLDRGLIAFHDAAALNWHAIVQQARNQGKLEALMAFARRDFPNDSALDPAGWQMPS